MEVEGGVWLKKEGEGKMRVVGELMGKEEKVDE